METFTWKTYAFLGSAVFAGTAGGWLLRDLSSARAAVLGLSSAGLLVTAAVGYRERRDYLNLLSVLALEFTARDDGQVNADEAVPLLDRLAEDLASEAPAHRFPSSRERAVAIQACRAAIALRPPAPPTPLLRSAREFRFCSRCGGEPSLTRNLASMRALGYENDAIERFTKERGWLCPADDRKRLTEIVARGEFDHPKWEAAHLAVLQDLLAG